MKKVPGGLTPTFGTLLFSVPSVLKYAIFAAFLCRDSRLGSSQQLPIAKKVAIRTDFLVSGLPGGPRDSAGMLWARCGAGVDLARGGVDSMQRQGIARPRRLGAVRVPSKVLPGCGIVMLPHCRARELFGRGVVMWPEHGVAKHGRSRGFGRLPVYRAVLLLSLKISNATLLKSVFRYNGHRGFVEEQARSPL